MTEKAKQIVRWQKYVPPDTGDGDDGGDSPEDGTEDGSGNSIYLELIPEYDMFGYCEGAERYIKAHVVPADLNYNATITAGAITNPGLKKTSSYNETLTFKNSDSASLNRELSDVTWSWKGAVISVDGDILTNTPEVTITGQSVQLEFAIGYGNLNVMATEAYIQHVATITIADESEAVAVFTWDGGVADIAVPMPDMECRTDIDPDDDDETCYIRDVVLHPCTLDVVSDNVSVASCES